MAYPEWAFSLPVEKPQKLSGNRWDTNQGQEDVGWPSGDFLRTLGAGIPHLWPRKGWRSLGGKTGWRWGAGGDGAGGGVLAGCLCPCITSQSSHRVIGLPALPQSPLPLLEFTARESQAGKGQVGN